MQDIVQISQIARKAVQQKNWPVVEEGANRILEQSPDHPEGLFLLGLARKTIDRSASVAAFRKTLDVDARRYDAAIELASLYLDDMLIQEALDLLDRYVNSLGNSPRYLDMAGTIYSTLDLPERAWPLYEQADRLQPGIDLFQANLAACAVHLGRIDEAEAIYHRLLEKHPDHQRNHYHLSRLKTATDDTHISQMLKTLERTGLSPDRNIFLYYALGKEYEDLEDWDHAFEYYRKGGDSISSVSQYRVEDDIATIDAVITGCTDSWLAEATAPAPGPEPIFVLGLPRTGSTLTERIISNHSQVRSIGETRHIEDLLKRYSGTTGPDRMNAEMIRAAAECDLSQLSGDYLGAVNYQLGDEPRFLEKLPYNFLYAGFISRAFPDSRIVYVARNPMDACFAMYKQVFTWAYQFSYSLDNLAEYYIAHRRLLDHWAKLLGERLIVIEYEAMVRDQETQTRILLDKLGLDFEQQCLDFNLNRTASTTASSVQVRQPIYARSVDKWKHFEDQLAPLRQRLSEGGVLQ